MGNILYLVALILIIAWAVGFFALNMPEIIHLLLVFAVVTVLFKVIKAKRS